MKSPLALQRRLRRKQLYLAMASTAALLSVAHPGFAQAPPPAETAMVKLIRGLIQSGALARDVGEALLAQAQAEALALQTAQRAPAAAPAVGALRPEPGDVRVPYVSQTVRDQIRDEVKGQVLAQAQAEGWAAPNETPEWSKRIRLQGDVRVRHESRNFSGDNSNIEIDWAAINAGSGYDVNPNTNPALPPLLNTREDRRNLIRARARLGLLADLSDRARAGIRLASGGDDSPVSTNETLGGGLSKKSIWLDQAWLSYELIDRLTLIGGRFENPFVSTDMLYSTDLNFDGLAGKYERDLGSNATGFATLGVTPLEYSADNAPSRSQSKMRSENKWLFGAQFGGSLKLGERDRLLGAIAYYAFKNTEGQVSEPCELYAGADSCSSDWARPAFMQKGNTLMLLRDIALDPNNPAGTPQPQYVGLASRFRLLDFNLRWDTTVAGMGLRLNADYVRNLSYDEDAIFARSRGNIVNNFAGDGATRSDFRSGGNAYLIQALLGQPAVTARGDWNVLAGYKRIEPDAMPDAFNDSTFHLGGTNARGYYLAGSYAIDKNFWFTGRWTAAKEVFGAPFSVDVLQLEFNGRY